MKRVLVVLSLCVAVAGCATPEWRQANGLCQARYDSEIPPNYVQRLVQRSKPIQVADGRVRCSTSGSGRSSRTTCIQGTRTEYIPYADVETVDLNEPYRDRLVRGCTVTACVQSYGNVDCEVR